MFKNTKTGNITCALDNSPPLLKGEVHLWSISLDLTGQLMEQCRAFLSEKEKQRISYFKFEKVQNDFIICQGILRYLLSRYMNKTPHAIQIERHKKGKPFVPDAPSLYFNMSNSGNMCVYAFSADGEIGIDLEQIRELPDLDELIQKNFTTKEISLIAQNPENKLKRFFQFWTFKESYLKAIGEGMRLTPDKLEFTMEGETIKLQGINGIFETEDWNFSVFLPAKNYTGALAYQGKEIKIKEFWNKT